MVFVVWIYNFYCLDLVFLAREKIFLLKSALFSSKYLKLTFEIMFSSNLQHAKLQYFLPIWHNHSGPSADAKKSKFLSYNFS